MNFLPATPEGNRLKTPFGDIELDATRAAKVAGQDLLIVGIRPEYFEDASLVEEAKRPLGSTFTGPVDVTEWLGDSQYAYIPYEAPEAITDPAAGAVPRARRRGAAHPGDRVHRLDQPDPRGPRGGVLARQPQGARLRPGDRGEPHPGRRGRVPS